VAVSVSFDRSSTGRWGVPPGVQVVTSCQRSCHGRAEVVPKGVSERSAGVVGVVALSPCLAISASPRLRFLPSRGPAINPQPFLPLGPGRSCVSPSYRLRVSSSWRLSSPRPRLILAVPPCQANVSGLFCIFKPYRPQFLARFNTSIWTNVYRRWHGGTACEKQSESMGKTPSVKTTMRACASRAMNSWRCLLRCDCAIAA